MAEIDIRSALAGWVRDSGESLYKAGKKVPAERFQWHPKAEEAEGRDTEDQIAECAVINTWGTQAFQTGSVPPIDWSQYPALVAEVKTGDALEALKTATEALAEAIEAFPADKLGDKIPHPFYEGKEITWADFAMIFYWNDVYHVGQVNYIQVLYGDNS